LTAGTGFKYDCLVGCPAHAYGAPLIPEDAQCCLCAGLAQAERDRAKFGGSNCMHRHRRRGRRPKSEPLAPPAEVTSLASADDVDTEIDPLLDSELDRAILMRARFE